MNTWEQITAEIVRKAAEKARRAGTVLALSALALVLMASSASAATCEWGPGQPLGFGSPTYTLPIPVIDTLAPTLRPERRKIWRQARNQALENWGIPFMVTVGPELVWDESIGTTGFADLLTPGAITIFRNTSTELTARQTMGAWDEATGAGLVVYAPWKPYWQDYWFRHLVGEIGHEIGHALGFGHPATAVGIMGGGNKPNAVELTAARGYYSH